MYNDHTLAVVIPCYNVEKEIKKTVEAMPQFIDHIIVVNDGSTDSTEEILNSLGDKRLIREVTERNLGVGGAMKRGFKAALARKADVIVKIDADGQMDPTLLPLLVEPIIRFHVDYTKGNRLLEKRHQKDMPLVRLCGNMALSFLNKLASGYWHIVDPQNGYVAISGRTLADLDLERLDNSYFFENSMLIHLHCVDALVLDIPMPSVYGEEASHMSIRRILLAFPIKLFSGFCYRIWQRHIWQDLTPVGLLLVLGTLLLGFGSTFGLYHWIHRTSAGAYASAGTVMIGALFIILGFQMFLQGLLLDVSWSRRLSSVDHAEIRNWIRNAHDHIKNGDKGSFQVVRGKSDA